MLTAGQVAPQAQLEESANDRTRSEVRGLKRDRFPYRNRFKSPFLSDFFLKSEPYVHRPARKVVREKNNRSRYKHFLADLELGRDPVLDS